MLLKVRLVKVSLLRCQQRTDDQRFSPYLMDVTTISELFQIKESMDQWRSSPHTPLVCSD